jgi:hypothetical protein
VLGMEKTDDTPVSTHGGGELILWVPWKYELTEFKR